MSGLGLTQQDLISMLYSALGTQIGLLVHSPDLPQLRQALYRAKAAAGDPALAQLTFQICQLDETQVLAIAHLPEKFGSR